MNIAEKMMKLFCISLVFLVILMIIGVDSVRGYVRVRSAVGELAVNEYSSFQLSSSDTRGQVEDDYVLLRSFSPAKQSDLSEAGESGLHSFYKIRHVNPDPDRGKIAPRVCAGVFMRFLAERHQDGYYIYCLRKLIV